MSFLDQIRGFSRGVLKPTETHHSEGPVAGGSSQLGVPEETTEFFETLEELESLAKQTANQISDAKHVVVFTGAGISTSAKIPDYRGPQGVWTLKEKGLQAKFEVTFEQARPTFSHMAVAQLLRQGLVKHVVSTNVDGLHRRSGLTKDEMSELHGNCFVEYCKACGTEYHRFFDTTKTGMRRNHETGRMCEKPDCGKPLYDNIINFGENLPISELSKAVEHSKKADLALVLGTSMRVKPACDLPTFALQNSGGLLAICNLQKTPYDGSSKLRVFAPTDAFLSLVLKHLQIEVPQTTPEGLEISPFSGAYERPKDAKIPRRVRIQSARPGSAAAAAVARSSTAGPKVTPVPWRSIQMIEHKTDEAFVHTSASLSETVFVRNCTNSQITVSGKAAKISIESCTNCRISISATVVSGTLELIRSSGVSLDLTAASIPTLTIDKAQTCNISISPSTPRTKIYWSESTGLVVKLGDREDSLVAPDVAPQGEAVNQFLSFVNEGSERYQTEAVAREGTGYATTQEKKAASEDRHNRLIAALDREFGPRRQ